MGRTKRTIRNLGLAGGAGLLAAALVVPQAGAATSTIQVTKDQLGGAAAGKALDISVLGKGVTVGASNVTGAVDALTRSLDLTAVGLGSALSPATRVSGILNGGEQKGCATAPLSALVTQLKGTLSGVALPNNLGTLADAVPALQADIACGTANLLGDASKFTAQGTGSVADIALALSPLVQNLIGTVHGQLDSTIAATPIKTVLDSTDAAAVQAVNAVNGLLSNTLGLGVKLPALVPTQTLGAALTQLEHQNLVEISIGKSIAENIGDTTAFTSRAFDDAGIIKILPNFRGANTAPLVTIKIAESEAKVVVNRATTDAVPTAKNTIVRIESELLPDLSLQALGLGNTPLSVLTGTLGYKAGPGFIEVAPGKDLTLFAGTPLESTIAVSKVTDPERLSNGHVKVTASAATIHLFKGLNDLVPGVNLGTILSNATVDNAIATLANSLPAGALRDLVGSLGAGANTGIPGIKLDFAKAEAEAGAVKVQAQSVSAVQPTSLPRTGGTPVDAAPYAVPALLGSAGGLRVLMRRRRRA